MSEADLHRAWSAYHARLEAEAERWRTYEDLPPDPTPEPDTWYQSVLLEIVTAARLGYRVQRLREQLAAAEAELVGRPRAPIPELPDWCYDRRRSVLGVRSPWRRHLPRRQIPQVTGLRTR